MIIWATVAAAAAQVTRTYCVTQKAPSEKVLRGSSNAPPERHEAGGAAGCPSPGAHAGADARWPPPFAPCAPSSSAAAPPPPSTAAPLPPGPRHLKYEVSDTYKLMFVDRQSINLILNSYGFPAKICRGRAQGADIQLCAPSSLATTRAKIAVTVLATTTLSESSKALASVRVLSAPARLFACACRLANRVYASQCVHQGA